MAIKDILKKKFSYLSIKLCIISLLCMAFVIGIYAYFSTRDLVAATEEQYQKKAVLVISTINACVDSKVNDCEIRHVQQMCDDLVKADSSIKELSLYKLDKSGRGVRIASSNHTGIGKAAEDHDIAPIKTRETAWKYMHGDDKKDVVEITAPIYIHGKPVASLGVYMDVNARNVAIKKHIIRAIVYAVAWLMALALLLYIAFRREVLKPLNQLIEGIKEVKSGNLGKRIHIRRKGELGELSREFDSMSEALQQRDEENLCLQEALREKWLEAESKANIDFLTDLENHRSFHIKLDAEINRASRTDSQLALLFCDLDKFKNFNDTNGHLLGDRVLFEVAKLIKESLRNYDIAARYGGEEFAVILPNAGSRDAFMVGERIRKNVEAHHFTTKDGFGKITISIGVATHPEDARRKEFLIAAADFAMYESKKKGGNHVTAFDSSIDLTQTKIS